MQFSFVPFFFFFNVLTLTLTGPAGDFVISNDTPFSFYLSGGYESSNMKAWSFPPVILPNKKNKAHVVFNDTEHKSSQAISYFSIRDSNKAFILNFAIQAIHTARKRPDIQIIIMNVPGIGTKVANGFFKENSEMTFDLYLRDGKLLSEAIPDLNPDHKPNGHSKRLSL